MASPTEDSSCSLVDLKKILKTWECAFKEKHSHKPGREDIASAPQEIQDSYSKYQKLKRNVTKSLSTSSSLESDRTENHNHVASNQLNNSTTSPEGNKDGTSKISGQPPIKDDGAAIDVWGAHLNKSKKASPKKEPDKTQSENGRKAVMQMFSKKLYSNQKEQGLISRGPRSSKPFSEKQSFWGKEESSSKDSSSVKTANSTENSEPEDTRGGTSDPNFFGTNLSARNIKFGSQSKDRSSLGPARPFGIGLPKARRHSLQTNWLEKCEKENEIKEIPSFAKDVDPKSEPRKKEFKGHSSGVKNDTVPSTVKSATRNTSESDEKMQKPDVVSKRSQSIDMTKNKEGDNNILPTRQTDSQKASEHCDINSSDSIDMSHASDVVQRTKKARDVAPDIEDERLAMEAEQWASSAASVETQESSEETHRPHKRSNVSPVVPPSKKRKTVQVSKAEEDDGQKDESANKGGEVEDNEMENDSPVKNVKKGSSSRAASTAPKRNLNENFVRLNMLTKSYRRKGKGMRGEAYKRMMWKQKTGAGGRGRGRGGWRGGGGGGRGGRGGFRGGRGGRGMSEGSDKCFKCGGTGHWASKCNGSGPVVKKKCEEESEDPESVMGPLPTLEEAALAAMGAKPQPGNLTDEGRGDNFEPLTVATPIFDSRAPPPSIEPLFEPTEDNTPDVTPKSVFVALKTMEYEEFRPNQEQVVMRILSGLSTLVVLSTGAGKSLCYQLPAYMYSQRTPTITLVISPLVSLMDDQVQGLPRCLKGARLHSHMSKPQREKVHAEIEAGKVQILLVSPEAVVSGGTNCLPHPSKMPPIAFACIDEAHCISEWSHNFRPSYLMLCKVLKDRLGVRCILALTATATKTTANSVAHHLGIADMPGAVIRGCSVPSNLQLSVSKDLDRERALIELLKGDRFRRLRSIIVYCIRREETERVASLIRTCLQAEPLDSDGEEEEGDKDDDDGGKDEVKEKKVKKAARKMGPKKKIKGSRFKKPAKLEANSCEAYHAGKSPAERRRVQNGFMGGHLRIVVATVAFGMGLDKADVRSVIHFNLPRTFESFVQEIGRAGRDGLPAQCHIFLDGTGSDVCELRRHTHGNSVDRFTIKKLVKRIFKPCKCNQILRLKAGDGEDDWDDMAKADCPGHMAAMPVEPTVQDLDIKEEGIATLLCYLELHPSRWLVSSPHTYATCTLNFYGGPRELHECAKRSPAVAAALARDRVGGSKKKAKEDSSRTSLTFDVVELASAMGWDLAPVKRELRQLQWKHDKFKGWVKTGVMVEFTDLSFSFRCVGNLSDSELDGVVDFLHGRVEGLEKRELGQLNAIYSTLEGVSKKSWMYCCDEVDLASSEHLRGQLIQYFVEELEIAENPDDAQKSKNAAKDEGRIRMTIRQFISVNHDRTFTGRAVARILQGIASPCFPAHVWGRDRRFWRCHIEANFRTLIRIANEEVMRMR